MIRNKYHKWYFAICNRAAKRDAPPASERHHIVPKSIGGDNSPDNLVYLTGREHFLCHWLLTKFTVGKNKKKMCYALHLMTKRTDKHWGRKLVGWEIEVAKRYQSQAMRGNTHSLGRKQTEEFKQRRRELMLGNTNTQGTTQSAEAKKKISKALLGNKHSLGYKHSAETRAKMSRSQRGRRHSPETRQKMALAAALRWRNKRDEEVHP